MTLDITFLPDMVFYCCLLHNMILDGKDVDVNELMSQLERENAATSQGSRRMPVTSNPGPANADTKAEPGLEGDELSGIEQREILETYIGNRRPQRG